MLRAMPKRETVADLITRIREYRRTASLSPGQLAARIGLDRKALADIDADGWNPKASTLRALEALMIAAPIRKAG